MNTEEQARIYRKTSSRKFADHLFSFYIIFKEPISCNSHPPQSTLCFLSQYLCSAGPLMRNIEQILVLSIPRRIKQKWSRFVQCYQGVKGRNGGYVT